MRPNVVPAVAVLVLAGTGGALAAPLIIDEAQDAMVDITTPAGVDIRADVTAGDGDPAAVLNTIDIEVLYNSALISSGESNAGAVVLYGGSVGTLDNSGIIYGSARGLWLQGTSIGSFTNSGSILSGSTSLDQAVIIEDTNLARAEPSSIVNTEAGVFRGHLGGVYMSNSRFSSFRNDGLIEATDPTGVGVLISSSGGPDYQIGVFTNGATGRISGETAMQIRSWAIGSLINDGTITGSTTGLWVSGQAGSIVNRGIIEGDVAIRFDGSVAGSGDVTNSGTVRGTGGTAIDFASLENEAEEVARDDLLTLLTGSRIEGDIRFGEGADRLDFSGFAGSARLKVSGLEDVVAGSRFYVWDEATSEIAIFDPDFIGQANVGKGQLAVVAGLNAFLESRAWSNAPAGGFSMSYAPATPTSPAVAAAETAVLSELDVDETPGTLRLWGDAFGSRSAGTTTASVGGVAVGVDTRLDTRLTLGAVGSYAASVAVMAGGDQSLLSQTAAIGVYGDYDAGFVDVGFSLLGGLQTHASTRRVTTAGGLETARGSFTGGFIAPGISAVVPVYEANGTRLSARGSATYLAGATTGYAETGSSMNLTVGGRTIQSLDTRFGVEIRQETLMVGIPAALNGRAGVLAQFNGGSATVPVTMLGKSANVATPGGSAYGVYAGVGVEAELGAADLAVNLDGSARTDGTGTLALRAGLSGDF